MASESADQALSPAETSFVICGRTWKLSSVSTIQFTVLELGPSKKKKWSNLLDAFATATLSIGFGMPRHWQNFEAGPGVTVITVTAQVTARS
jgi:hypothetical protein